MIVVLDVPITMDNKNRMHHFRERIEELEVVESELSSVKKDARVYKQQPNSMVFFRDDHHQALNECRKQLHELREELKRSEAENTIVK